MNNINNKCLIGKKVPNTNRFYLDIAIPLPDDYDYEQEREFCYQCDTCRIKHEKYWEKLRANKSGWDDIEDPDKEIRIIRYGE